MAGRRRRARWASGVASLATALVVLNYNFYSFAVERSPADVRVAPTAAGSADNNVKVPTSPKQQRETAPMNQVSPRAKQEPHQAAQRAARTTDVHRAQSTSG
eukprot:scaffold2_cov110-Isochrysis_galbana.AAC.2